MSLFNDDSSILEKVSIDHDNKVAIYDDYCDDLYAIKNSDIHETCHHDFSFQLDYASHDNYFVRFAPTIIHEKKFAYVESNKNYMLVDHEKNALCDSYIVEFIHVATYDDYCDETYGIKISDDYIYKTMITLFLKITLLMWKQFIVFKSLMIVPLFRMRRSLLMWRVVNFLCL